MVSSNKSDSSKSDKPNGNGSSNGNGNGSSGNIADKLSFGSEYITLDEKQYKVFNALRSKSGIDQDKWPTVSDLHNELRMSVSDVKKIIDSLDKTEGIILTPYKSNKTMRYGLDPVMLETVVKSSKTQAPTQGLTNLYLAEPAFGTKAFDDKYTMKGLAAFLKVNGLSSQINEVIIQGGVVPHVPPFYSKGYATALKFLSKIPRTDSTKSLSEELLEQKIDNRFEKDFYNKFINNDSEKKIIDLSDAFSAAGYQLKTLMDALPESTLLRIHAGEEDKKNIGHIEETYVQQWAKEKDEQIKTMKKDVESGIVDSIEKKIIDNTKKVFLEDMLKDRKFKRDTKESWDTYTGRIKDAVSSRLSESLTDFSSIAGEDYKPRIESEFSDLDAVSNNIMHYLYFRIRSVGKTDNTQERLDELNKNISSTDELLKQYKSKLESIDGLKKWTDKLLGGSFMNNVTKFTGHYPAFADEMELAFKKAKDHYSKNFYNMGLKQHVMFHASGRKMITVGTGVVNDIAATVKGDDSGNDKVKIDYENTIIGSKKVLIIHNMNSSFSDNTGSASIKDAKIEMNYRNMVLEKLYGEVIKDAQPDIVLLGGHGVGGFRAMPWFKDSEHMMEGKFVEGQEISYLIQLPTLQDIPKLEWLVGHNFVNWHTKRFKQGPYASAAIIHTENPDKVNSFTVVDTARLQEFGKIAEEIDGYDKELKVYAKELKSDANSSEMKKTLKKMISERKKDIQASYRKIEATGDWHVGDADNKDRYSKYELLKASQIYQQEHGLPSIVSLDELVHGTESRIFSSASRYEAYTPEKFQKLVIEPILSDKTLNGDQKAYLIAKESARNHRGITIPNGAKQFEELKRILEPYIPKILDNGGEVIFMSGNHQNKSNRESDEATMVANMFPLKYIDNYQIKVFSGDGNDVGLGTILLEGGQKLFGMHKFPTVQDEIYGVMKHMRKMNNDSDIVIAGDRHQTGIGYADAHMVALHPGYETMNSYVPYVGMPAGVRGFINVFFDPNKRGVYKADFVLNPTLEAIAKKHMII